MTSKGLSLFFCLHHLLLPFSPSKVKLLKKDVYITHTLPALPFLHSLVDLFPSFTITSLKLLFSGLLITTSSKYPMDTILGLTLLNLSTALTHFYFQTIFSLVFCVTIFSWFSSGPSRCCFCVSTASFLSSTRVPEVTRPLLFATLEFANYGPQGKSGLLPVFITKFIRIEPHFKNVTSMAAITLKCSELYRCERDYRIHKA